MSQEPDTFVPPPAVAAGADLAEHVPPPIPGQLTPMDLSGLLREIERAYIDAALAQTAGNRRRAATLLGLRRTTLVEKLRRREKREHDDPIEASAAHAET